MGIFKQAYLRDRVEQMPYFYWLCATGVIGIRTYNKMQSVFGSPKAVYENPMKWEAAGVFTSGQLKVMREQQEIRDIHTEYDRMLQKGIKFIPYESEEFPERLKTIPDAPIGLFLRGKMPPQGIPIISVIGARACSDYGRMMAEEIGEYVAAYNISLVSGMARGVDSISQMAACRAGGYSMAVLGGGVDIVYPRESLALYEYLGKNGGILSEYAPGTKPQGKFFALRNRIISGLADVICVVEAKAESGTMITVDAALEQGREVYAVPGRINDITSRGCHDLIKQGAGIVTDIEEFVKECLENYRLSSDVYTVGTNLNNEAKMNAQGNEIKRNTGLLQTLCEEERNIVRVLSEDSFTVDELARKLAMQAGEVLPFCLALTSKGLVKNIGAGRFLPTLDVINMRNFLI